MAGASNNCKNSRVIFEVNHFPIIRFRDNDVRFCITPIVTRNSNVYVFTFVEII